MAHELEEVRPVYGWNLPAPQLAHELEPAPLYLPAPQLAHPLVGGHPLGLFLNSASQYSELCQLYLPAPQLAQTSHPVVVTLPSEDHVKALRLPSNTLLGPVVPLYVTPFTISLSQPLSVLKTVALKS